MARIIYNKSSRIETDCPVFGQPCQLIDNVLPTYLDVGKFVLHTQIEMAKKSSGNHTKNIPFATIFGIVAEEVRAIWNKASIPCSSKKNIIKKIQSMWTQKEVIRKKNITEINNHVKDEWSKLFDICQCKCKKIPNIPFKCTCPTHMKVKNRELEFLFDQRGSRLHVIGGFDRNVTARLKVVQKETAKVKNFLQHKQRKEKASEDESQTNQDESDPLNNNIWFIEDGSDTDFDPCICPEQISERNYQDLENLVKVCDRYNISSVAGALLVNVYLKDLGLLTKSNIVDRKKLDRQRQLYRDIMQKEEEIRQKNEPMTSLYFDGRQDLTIALKEKNGKKLKITKKEEHFSLVEEPKSLYLGHVTPKCGTGVEIAKSLYSWVLNTGAIDTLLVVGGDGCRVNTGYENGVIACLESFIGRPLQRFICLLHANELPLRAALNHYVGRTIGPDKHEGSISKQIHDPQLTDLPIVNFKKVDSQFPVIDEEVHTDLSTDQLYLYDICQGIISGQIDPGLAARQPGTIGHARWLTTASSILRLYVSTRNPTKKLNAVVNIIIRLYAIMWFQIKSHPKAVDGPKNLFMMVELVRQFPQPDQVFLKRKIQNNAYFAHSENILLTMLTDTDEAIRHRAVDLIQKIRAKSISISDDSKDEEYYEHDDSYEHNLEDEFEISFDTEFENYVPEDIQRESVRAFKVPKLNFNATSYVDMINWDNEIFEPPLTLYIDDAELNACIKNPFEVLPYPGHTQAVERAVKLTTEASSLVIGEKQRDGMIRQKIDSRKIVKKFISKKDALPLLNVSLINHE